MIDGSPKRTCKICTGPVIIHHVKGETPYFLCQECNFLQNYYWEDAGKPDVNETQLQLNSKWRKDMWPTGERADMRRKGWEMVELMSSPVAWWSRKVHALLKHLPGYATYVKQEAKRKLKKLMDFGCGHGVTVFELAEEGFDIIGLDPYSPTDDARIVRKSLYDMQYPDSSFDGIFAIETMEHMVDVLPIYRELYRILKPGGVLLMQTRRLEDPDFIAQGEKWFYLNEPSMHVAIYSETAMRRIANMVGFREADFRGVRLARFIK